MKIVNKETIGSSRKVLQASYISFLLLVAGYCILSSALEKSESVQDYRVSRDLKLLDDLRSLKDEIHRSQNKRKSEAQAIIELQLLDDLKSQSKEEILPKSPPKTPIPNPCLPEKRSILPKEVPLLDRIGEYGIDSCKRRESIYFLKTSKTGSTTFANILQRFGFAREGTNFLFGEQTNGALFFINGYMPFNEDQCYLGRDLVERPKFDISYVHMRYNKTAVDHLMKKDVFKVSILRDPLTNFISGWKYYNGLIERMRKAIRKDFFPRDNGIDDPRADFIGEMNQFLKMPWEYLKNFPYAHSAYYFAVNPQFLFFGYPSYLLNMSYQKAADLVDQWLEEISEEFDHILILEDLDRSLAILMLKLCWSIEDVMHLKLNSMRQMKRTLSEASKRNLREFNWADQRLYDFFRRKHEREVQQIGKEKIDVIVEKIRAATKRITEECLDTDTNQHYAPDSIRDPVLKPEKQSNQTCYLMTVDASDYLIVDQIERWKEQYPDWRGDDGDFPSCKKKFNEEINSTKEWYQDFLTWETNEFDLRNSVPLYLQNLQAQNFTYAYEN